MHTGLIHSSDVETQHVLCKGRLTMGKNKKENPRSMI